MARGAIPSGTRWILQLRDKSIPVVPPMTCMSESLQGGNTTSSAPRRPRAKEAIVRMINGLNSCTGLANGLFGRGH